MSSSFNTADAASYDSVALSFDHLSKLYSTPFAEHLVATAELGSNDLVLDLASGTGVVARNVIERGARCVAADLSCGMLRVAVSEGPTLRPVLMDAERSALQFDSFDAIVSLFGMMHFPEPKVVLNACADMLKPGGTLAFAVGSPAPWPMALAQIPRILSDFVRQKQGLLLKAPIALNDFLDTQVPHSRSDTETPLAVQPHQAAQRLVALTKDAGFCAVKSGWIRKRFVIETADAFWELQAVYSSRARKQFESMTPAQVTSLKKTFVETAEGVQERKGTLVYDVATTWVRATKPL